MYVYIIVPPRLFRFGRRCFFYGRVGGPLILSCPFPLSLSISPPLCIGSLPSPLLLVTNLINFFLSFCAFLPSCFVIFQYYNRIFILVALRRHCNFSMCSWVVIKLNGFASGWSLPKANWLFFLIFTFTCLPDSRTLSI